MIVMNRKMMGEYSEILFISVNRMEEEIVVDDIDENSTADTQQADDSTTPVMPLLYIQQNKVRSIQSSNVNKTLVSPNTQLAAIINPVKNQVIILKAWCTECIMVHILI